MATLEEIVVQLTAESSQLRAQLQTAAKVTEDASKKMEAAIQKFSDNSNKNMSFFQQALATTAGFLGGAFITKGVGLAKDAVAGLTNTVLEGIDAAAQSDAQFLRLNNSLALNGKFSAAAAEDLREYADEQEKLTGIGDEVVASNLAFLSSLTRLDSEGLKVAQSGAIDLAAALGKDLDTVTQAVGKAINGNGAALKKLGVEFDESGNKATNFKNIQEALSRFSGVAAANTGSYSGAVKLLGVAFDNVTKELGKAFTQNKVVTTLIAEVSKVLFDLSDAAKTNGTAIREGIAFTLLAVAEAAAFALQALDLFFRSITTGVKAVLLPVYALGDALNALGDLISGVDNKDPFRATKDTFDSFVDSASNQTFLGTLANKIDEIKDKGFKAFGGIGDTVQDSTEKLQANAKAIVELSQVQKLAADAKTAFVNSLLSESAAVDANAKFKQATLDQSLADEKITNEIYFADKLKLLEDQQAIENEILAAQRATTLANEADFQAAKTALANKQGLEKAKLMTDQRKAEEADQRARLSAFSGFFGNLATLQQSSNKELAAIGKAAAITQATIDGIVAVQGAYKSGSVIGGPALGAVFAAAAGVATAANIARIAGVGLKGGINEVPGIGNQDNFPAVLAPGERVVPAKSNEDLTNFLKNQDANGGRTINFTLNLTIAPGTGISRSQAADLVEGINDYIAAGGLPILER